MKNSLHPLKFGSYVSCMTLSICALSGSTSESITLTSLLEGFEDCIEIKYQWECDKGNGFEAVEGGNGDSYSYAATAESMTWNFRLAVYYR